MLRTNPASRYHHNYEHVKYGIYHWFKERNVTNQEYILEIIAAFAVENGFKAPANGDKQKSLLLFVHDRFSALCDYAVNEFGI
jgi:hypothetical protein